MPLKHVYVSSYPDELLQRWVDWNLSFLNKPCEENASIESLLGIDNSNARTRASEFLRLGFLKGRFTRQKGQEERPRGISLMSSDENPQSDFGFVALGLGVMLSQEGINRTSATFEAACAVMLMNLGIEYSAGHVLYSSLFDYLLEQYEQPGTRLTDEQRFYLAAGMFATLSSGDSGILLDSFIASRPIQYLIFNNVNPPLRIQPSQFISEFSKGKFAEGDFSPARFHNYWIGTSRRPYGFFTCGQRSYADFFRGIRRLEQEYLARGADSPFKDTIAEPVNNVIPCKLETISSILSLKPGLSSNWSVIMKTMYDGVLGALAKLRDIGVTAEIPNVFYAHGVTGDVTIESTDLQLAIAHISESEPQPEIGDLIVIKNQPTVVKEVNLEGGSAILKLRRT